MAIRESDAAPLIGEYETLVEESTPRDGEIDWIKLHGKLVQTAEWTDAAASHLANLAQNYGSFMLRNALALAIAAQIEDGEFGF
jgi:hypothetical protein